MQYGVKEEVEIKQQEREEEVRCFWCWGLGHYKWECPNIKAKRKRKKEGEVAHVVRPQKAQQAERSVHSKWEKAQKYYREKNVPEDT